MKSILPLAATMLALVLSPSLSAQTKTPENQLSVGVQWLSHGQYQGGGLPRSDDPAVTVSGSAGFLLSRLRLNVGYRRPGIETRAVIQNSAVWGMSGNTALALYEGWVKLQSRKGLFVQLGRIALSYDDERIIGPNDFAMASSSHDLLRAGYEGHGHKVHALFAYNQNGSNLFTNTYYTGGAQYYKTMQTLWYHYDIPVFPLGASLLFMNVGMQAGDPADNNNPPHVANQQLLGAFIKYSPSFLTLEASYYHQMGKYADNFRQDARLNAWMASIKASARPLSSLGVTVGYDYLSGDDYVPVTYGGNPLGLPRHEVFKSFTPLFGSRTKFYGMLDYFYQSAYTNGFSPGLQNAFLGVNWNPWKKFSVGVTYHYLAVGTRLADLEETLGHDVDLTLGYRFSPHVSLTINYTYMNGSETMKRLKQGSSSSHAHWLWFSLVVSSEVFKTRW